MSEAKKNPRRGTIRGVVETSGDGPLKVEFHGLGGLTSGDVVSFSLEVVAKELPETPPPPAPVDDDLVDVHRHRLYLASGGFEASTLRKPRRLVDPEACTARRGSRYIEVRSPVSLAHAKKAAESLAYFLRLPGWERGIYDAKDAGAQVFRFKDFDLVRDDHAPEGA